MKNKMADEDEIFLFALLVIYMFSVFFLSYKPNYTAGTVLSKSLYFMYVFDCYLRKNWSFKESPAKLNPSCFRSLKSSLALS